MGFLVKIVRVLASLPIIGGALVFVIGFFPLLAIIPLNLSTGLSILIGGLLTAAWCYFLSAKKVINIVTPFIPIPLWIIGILVSGIGVYGIITNTWDETGTNTEVVMPETKSSANEPVPAAKPDTTPDTDNKRKQPAEDVDFDQVRRDAEDYALEQMERSFEDMQRVLEEIGPDKFEEVFNAQRGNEDFMSFEEAMVEMEKQIDELRRRIDARENVSSAENN